MTVTSDLAALLGAAGLSGANWSLGAQSIFIEGEPWENIQQDVAVTLDQFPGTGEQFERTFDGIAIQLQSRGPQNDPSSAEQLAMAVDDTILALVTCTMGASRVLSTQRVGGLPRLLQVDAALRRIFTASYLFVVARTQF